MLTTDRTVIRKTPTTLVVNDEAWRMHIISKDDTERGGEQEESEGKAPWINAMTCNVFGRLKRERLPVAFIEKIDRTTFSAPSYTLLPYKVVVHREAHGSLPARRPEFKNGHVFQDPFVEFFLKTSGQKWQKHDLPCDDPFLNYAPPSGFMPLYLPGEPIESQKPFLVLSDREVFCTASEWKLFEDMEHIAICAFALLEKAWEQHSVRLIDLTVEFGLSLEDSVLLLGNVITNESWTLLGPGGERFDTKPRLPGVAVENEYGLYEFVSGLTEKF